MTVAETTIPDVQASADSRHIAIDKVGIKDIRHPIKIRDRSGGDQHTIVRQFASQFQRHTYVAICGDFKFTRT